MCQPPHRSHLPGLWASTHAPARPAHRLHGDAPHETQDWIPNSPKKTKKFPSKNFSSSRNTRATRRNRLWPHGCHAGRAYHLWHAVLQEGSGGVHRSRGDLNPLPPPLPQQAKGCSLVLDTSRRWLVVWKPLITGQGGKMNDFKSSGRWFTRFKSSERKSGLLQKLREVMWTFFFCLRYKPSSRRPSPGIRLHPTNISP